MKKISYAFLFIIIILKLIGCKEEILFKSSGYQPKLVIDGILTNKNEPCTIKISYSSPVDFPEFATVENCEVSIIENENNRMDLSEMEPGVYTSSPDDFIGIPGNTYSLYVKTPNGNEYKTDPQLMNDPVDIDSVYAEFTTLEDPDYAHGLPGYKFSISTEQSSVEENYFLWNMTETYQYHADYKLHGMYNKWGEFLEIGIDTSDIFSDVYWCWKTQNSGYVVTGTTDNLSTPQISKQPILFVGTDTRKLQKRYSLLVNQYSITEETYSFWKKIQDQSSNDNFLVANQPFKIIGNLKNINNPDEEVYGYFTVATVDQTRIFVDKPSAPFYYTICFVNYDLDNPISNYYVISEEGYPGTVYGGCLDCTSKSGTIEKPDFWIDK
ncbi:MAG: DUF4249 domain-containing protein [Bacteroidetes bacterium]|nr:DUF4249 domain-containing protein [Bacteroidota bacterium]